MVRATTVPGQVRSAPRPDQLTIECPLTVVETAVETLASELKGRVHTDVSTFAPNRFETARCPTRSARIEPGFFSALPYILHATFLRELVP
jgi:hypothetical protein